ncbi:M43 family zinc metalloprotease [Taibaiella koreensis]|uniref:M43 family zinc metalloprotease n=1 Tax=Taibaiella koreensis TaxID=1268548 RepID=UPI0013C34E66|nr:M43 family zinc metalloprotease [Taibaiella koreensis]
MKKWFPLAIACLPLAAQAQNTLPAIPRCGFELVWKQMEQAAPGFREQYDARIKAQLADPNTKARPTGTVYDIPVVVHVVYYQNGAVTKGNLPDSVIQNQIKVLNQAYRKTHADTGNLRAIFKPLSADAEIQFHLATQDSNGNATTGIVHKATNIEYFGDISIAMGDISSLERVKKTALGGDDAWNTSRYLNIWIADMRIAFNGQVVPAVMGIARPPINPLPPNWPAGEAGGLAQMVDGVILQYHAVGNNNPYIGELSAAGLGNQGRTAVHEVGHYLGLRHIWGDPEQGQECTPQGDDGIGDTPAQATMTDMQANPPSPTLNTCGAGSANDLPDLWENYMDYSKDNFQSMFTKEQVTHMRSICANQRDTLFMQPPAPVGVNEALVQDKALKVYPQPAAQYLDIDFDGKFDRLRVINVLGTAVLTDDKPGTGLRRLDISRLASGNYYLQLSGNGRLYNRQIVIRR